MSWAGQLHSQFPAKADQMRTVITMDSRFRTRVGVAALAAIAALSLAACTSKPSASTSTSPGGVAPVAAASTTLAPTSSVAATTSAPVTVSGLTSDSTASSSSTASSTTSATTTATTPPKPKPLPPALLASPAFGAAGLSPTAPISIKASNGTLASLTVTNADGKAVAGTLSADKTTWTLNEALGYGGTYTVSGSAVGVGGTTKISGSYTTVNPDDVINASISPNADATGTTVGIAAPILLSLGTDITDPDARTRIEKAITITTTPKTAGAFAWIQHDDGIGLDWRPQTYWKPGTKVTVTAKLYGVNMGGNLWGKEDISQSFDIGRSEITKGDINTHRLQVFENGTLKFDFPTSFGLESDPGRVTRGGTYFVMGKEYLHLMSNPAYHYFNFKAYYAVRISNNGTFIHANDGTDDIQGYENETHGCANLSTDNAKLFYDQTMYGDPVEISHSSIPLSADDGDNHDWSIPWSEWVSLGQTNKSA